MRTDAELTGDRALGVFLRYARLRAGLSISELAARAQVATSAISRLEHGIRSMRTVGLCRIGEVLGIDLMDLLAARGLTAGIHFPGTLHDYLRVRYDLPEEAIAEVEMAIAQIVRRYRQRREIPEADECPANWVSRGMKLTTFKRR